MTSTQPVNQPVMKVWRPQGFAGVEVERHENISRLTFPPAVTTGHDITIAFKFGLNRFKYGRKQYRLEGGRRFFVQHAGEVFAATPQDNELTSIWTLRLYPKALNSLKASLDMAEGFSYFPEMIVPSELNAPLFKLTARTVSVFDKSASTLERETRLLDLVHTVLAHCSAIRPPQHKLGKEHKAVTLIKEVLETHSERDNTLDELATLTSLNKHYLYRVFCRDVGLSPHSYQTSVRVHRVKDLLAAGVSIAQASLETGFTDQSHLTRVFKKYTQVTPGQFQRDSLGAERFRELGG